MFEFFGRNSGARFRRNQGKLPGAAVAEVAELGGRSWKTLAKLDARELAEVSDLGYKTRGCSSKLFGHGRVDAMAIPSGTETFRPFLPSRDFERSKAFYEALGFTKRMDGEVAIFAIGASEFILQRYYQKEWAENFMLQILVDDLDAWWAHVQALDLVSAFGVQAPRPPAMQAWGLRVAYLFDPCGVLWHIAERVRTASAD